MIVLLALFEAVFGITILQNWQSKANSRIVVVGLGTANGVVGAVSAAPIDSWMINTEGSLTGGAITVFVLVSVAFAVLVMVLYKKGYKQCGIKHMLKTAGHKLKRARAAAHQTNVRVWSGRGNESMSEYEYTTDTRQSISAVAAAPSFALGDSTPRMEEDTPRILRAHEHGMRNLPAATAKVE